MLAVAFRFRGPSLLAAALLLAAPLPSPRPARAQSMGPDTFGYMAGPTPYDFVDLAAGGGTPLYLGDNDELDVGLPWPFPFYGDTWDVLRVGANGALRFGSGGNLGLANACLPASGSGNSNGAPDVAVFWDDLNPSSGGEVRTWHDAVADRFIVSWEGVPRWFATGAVSVQVQLFPSGILEIHWQDADFGDPAVDGGASATVGIQDRAGGTQFLGNALQWSCDTPGGVLSGTALVFAVCTDSDADGHLAGSCGGTDCDDLEILAYPGAPEVCDGIDNDCDPATDETADSDGDGFSACDGDCAPADPTAFPGAAESCNGMDDDCDDLPDDGLDGDGDGFTPCAGDCDDSDGSRYPFAPESCDGVDSDCAGDLAVEADGDGDGFAACAGDCDDGDGGVSPAAAETCDGIDNDCNSLIDEGFPDTDADGSASCGGDCDDSDPSLNAVDADGDGVDSCGGDCDDADSGRFPGNVETCDASDNDCDTEIDEGFDADGDGSFDGSDPGCAVTWTPLDCDDGDASIFPGALETCDGIDEDCDGAPDDLFVLLSGGIPAAPIPDPTLGASLAFEILAPDGPPIADVDVWLDITHTRDADLDISLVSPFGWVVVLSSDNGGDGDGYLGTTFDDESPVAVEDAAAPFSEAVAPESHLSTYDTQAPGGAWTLWVVDDEPATEDGTFWGWELWLSLDGTADADGDAVTACEDCDDTDPSLGLPDPFCPPPSPGDDDDDDDATAPPGDDDDASTPAPDDDDDATTPLADDDASPADDDSGDDDASAGDDDSSGDDDSGDDDSGDDDSSPPPDDDESGDDDSGDDDSSPPPDDDDDSTGTTSDDDDEGDETPAAPAGGEDSPGCQCQDSFAAPGPLPPGPRGSVRGMIAPCLAFLWLSTRRSPSSRRSPPSSLRARKAAKTKTKRPATTTRRQRATTTAPPAMTTPPPAATTTPARPMTTTRRPRAAHGSLESSVIPRGCRSRE